MNTPTVTWRQTVAAAVAVVVALVGVVVLFSSDGLPAVNASASRGDALVRASPVRLRWCSWTATAAGPWRRFPAESGGDQISVAEGGAGAYLLNDTTAEVTPIETADLRFGARSGLAALGGGRAVSEVGPAGLTVVNPDDGQASALPLVGDPFNFDVPLASPPVGRPRRRRVDDRRPGAATDELDVVDGRRPRPRRRRPRCRSSGDEPLVLDPANRRARLGEGAWQRLDTDADPSEIVGQVNGPAGPCGWIGANDDLWCVAADGIAERATIDGLDIDGADSLAIAGDAGVVVRRVALVDRADRLAGTTSGR